MGISWIVMLDWLIYNINLVIKQRLFKPLKKVKSNMIALFNRIGI